MERMAARASQWHGARAALLALTLVTSAFHFADNAFHLDLYPGPGWLTRKVILSAWLLIPLAACTACKLRSRVALIAYAALGFGGLAHFLMPCGMHLPPRCLLTIGGEALASAGLIVCSVLSPGYQPRSVGAS